MIYFFEMTTASANWWSTTMNSTGFEAVGFSKPSEFWAAMERKPPA